MVKTKKETEIISHKERLWFLCEIEMSQSKEQRENFAQFLRNDCNPYVIEKDFEGEITNSDTEKEIKALIKKYEKF